MFNRFKKWFLGKPRAAPTDANQIITPSKTDLERLERSVMELREWAKEFQTHTDYEHRDIIVLLNRMMGLDGRSKVYLRTEHPVAVESNDHKFPRGTANDNTRYPRFCQKCEQIFGRKLRLLDLGCAGGGLVWDFLINGHFAVGLEGSDYSLKNLRAEWRTIPDHLFTCDITKPFTVVDAKTDETMRFDIVSCWEVLEHIHEKDLPGLLENVQRHLDTKGLFVASVATFEDYEPQSGALMHVTVKNRDWWEALFRKHGFQIIRDLFEPLDFARGSGNGRYDWSALTNPELGFHVVARPVL